jgi:hypothetical protein
MPSGESINSISKRSQVLIQNKGNIIVSDKVFNKIKYLCWKFNKVEWSGITWLDITGTLEDPANLKIIVSDFTLLDIGTSGYTEFSFDPEIMMDIYDKYPDYIAKKYGLMHSHNIMRVFFSGTDTDTLLEQAFLHNFFVSVIVNNNYDLIGKISYKGSRIIKSTRMETYYNQVGNIMFPYNKNITEEKEEEVVYVIDCNVAFEQLPVIDEDLDTQIKACESRILARIKEKEAKGQKMIGEISNYNLGSNKNCQVSLFNKEVLHKKNEKKLEESKLSFNARCENFVKRLVTIDYTGEEYEYETLTLQEAFEEINTWYADTPEEEYLTEVAEVCGGFLEEEFDREIQANWANKVKFEKFRMMLSSQMYKLLASKPEILEIVDFELKELQKERDEDFNFSDDIRDPFEI